jgi:excisionase family DNA binding protein
MVLININLSIDYLQVLADNNYMTNLTNQVLTLQECSEYLKIAESTIYVLARKGKIPCQKVGRNWRFRKEALDRWLEGEQVLRSK